MGEPKRRGCYDYIPALAGLPDDQQEKLYKQAWKEAGWSWQLFALMGLQVGVLLGLGFFGGRFLDPVTSNRPLRFAIATAFLLIFAYGFTRLTTAYNVYVLGPRIWRKLTRFCSGCGYDLTGNTSGKCPECGREIDEAEYARREQLRKDGQRRAFQHRRKKIELIVMVAILASAYIAGAVITVLWLVGVL